MLLLRCRAVTHTYNLGNRAWAEINELFGDGAEYEFAMYYDPTNSTMDLGEDGAENNVEDLEDGEEVMTRKTKEVRLKDVYEPAVIAQRMLTEEDEIIRMTDIPERYQVFLPHTFINFRPKNLLSHPLNVTD